jgi:hypothetical protein
MPSNGRIFTSENLIVIRQMAAQGSSAPEIAKAIGSTPSSVRVNCSHRKIRLRRGRRHPRTLEQAHRVPEHVTEHMVVAFMPAPLYAEFHRKALHLHKPVAVLASMLLNAIAMSNIYDAVLDDGE